MALFNKQLLKTVVSIETEIEKGKYQPAATGFLIGFPINEKLDPAKRIYRIFLLTNRHVFRDQDKLWFRFDRNDEKTSRFPVDLKVNGEIKWLAHKDESVDLALLTINPGFLTKNSIEWSFVNEELFAYPDDFDTIGIELGDGIFIPGFPMGISGNLQNHAIVRHGTIARIDDEIINSLKSFMIDAMIFPGNSGGPVFIKPELAALDGTKNVNMAYLIGVVSGYQPYLEPLYSHQANPPIIAGISSDNSGLATVVPLNFAREIYNDFVNSKVKIEETMPGKNRVIEERIEASNK